MKLEELLMTDWVEGYVEKVVYWNNRLSSIYVSASLDPYQAGQFCKLSMMVNGERISRAYSFVNAPTAPFHEFYIIRIEEGRLTPSLFDLKVGDTVELSKQANGFMTLAEVPPGRDLWMLATGTAVGPFLSILADRHVADRFDNLILVHAVRLGEDLTYQPLIAEYASLWPERFRYVPVISRENSGKALKGRIPDLIFDGKLEKAAGLALSSDYSQVMICGNPMMVKDTLHALERKGLRKNLRREPGQITMENYW